jgi:AraC-like DNA-binding protein
VQFRRTTDLTSFERALTGAALVGDGWLHFCAHEALFGVVLWGRPSGEATDALIRSLKLELASDVPPHRSLVDVSRVESVDAASFEALNDYVSGHRSELSRAVTRLALVRPSGLAGAVTSGFYSVAGAPYPVEVFDSARQALTWLDEGEAVAAALEALVVEVTGRSPLLSRLHAALRERLTSATLESIAKALSVSDRTLQRRLQDAGTSFAAELQRARVEEAQRRMRDSDEPLASIALAVGFSSQQHLSTAFKKATGEQPSAWRKRARAHEPS